MESRSGWSAERVDPLCVAELRELIGDRFTPLLRSYLVTGFNLVSRMAEAIEEGRMGDLAECAHELARASSAIGALELARLCRSVEAAAALRRAVALPRLHCGLRREYLEVAALLEEEIRLSVAPSAHPRERVA